MDAIVSFFKLHVVADLGASLQKLIGILLLMIGSAFLAGSETALFSLSKTQRESMGSNKDSASKRILRLLRKPRRLISTLILGNEIINISISTLVTSLIEHIFGVHLSKAWVGLVATLITVPLLVVFCELIPKTVAIKTASRWSRFVSGPLLILTWLLWIPRSIIGGIAGAITFLFVRQPKKADPSPALQEQEFRTLVDLGNAEGEIQSTERKMIHNVFDFGDLTVGQVMTPVQRIFALPMDMPLPTMIEKIASQNYARIPLYQGATNHIVGILFAKDLVGILTKDSSALSALLHPPLFVPKRAKCERLFREFKRRKVHLALVVDEYGNLAGLITMDDLLQTLFGNLAEATAGGVA